MRRIVGVLFAVGLSAGPALAGELELPPPALSARATCPPALQARCAGLNQRRKRAKQDRIDADLLKRSQQGVISDYYRACVEGLPEQVSRFIETELITEGVAHGFAHAARRYEMPVRTEVRVHHGYVYAAAAPTSTVPAELGELAVRTKAQLAPVIGRLGELWHGRWLPEIREHVAAMQAIDLIGATAAELLAHYDEARARMRRVWELHFEIVFPSYLAVSEFEELYRELFDAGPFDAYRLLQGFESKTTEIGADLFRLSRRALESPTVTAILESEAAADVPCRLAHSVAGLAFLAALDEHLAAYGNRSQMWGLAWPSFVEDPSALIKIVKDYIRPRSSPNSRRC